MTTTTAIDLQNQVDSVMEDGMWHYQTQCSPKGSLPCPWVYTWKIGKEWDSDKKTHVTYRQISCRSGWIHRIGSINLYTGECRDKEGNNISQEELKEKILSVCGEDTDMDDYHHFWDRMVPNFDRDPSQIIKQLLIAH
jgi:hypothetical protein